MIEKQKRIAGRPTNAQRGLPDGRTVKIVVLLSPAGAAKVQRIADRNEISVSAMLAQMVDMMKEEA